jgi:GMP synthase-like glutamine amidotransferase
VNILLFNNGTRHLKSLRILLEKYGSVTVTGDKAALISPTVDLVVLSGGHHHSIIHNPEIYQPEIEFVKSSTVTILGICLGAEIIAYSFKATLENLSAKTVGLKTIQVIKPDPIFTGISDFKVYESHKWAITKLSADLEGLARSNDGFEIIRHKTKPIYGLQFHPEMFESKSCGDEIFANLLRHLN